MGTHVGRDDAVVKHASHLGIKMYDAVGRQRSAVDGGDGRRRELNAKVVGHLKRPVLVVFPLLLLKICLCFRDFLSQS